MTYYCCQIVKAIVYALILLLYIYATDLSSELINSTIIGALETITPKLTIGNANDGVSISTVVYSLPTTRPDAGQVPVSNGTSNLTWLDTGTTTFIITNACVSSTLGILPTNYNLPYMSFIRSIGHIKTFIFIGFEFTINASGVTNTVVIHIQDTVNQPSKLIQFIPTYNFQYIGTVDVTGVFGGVITSSQTVSAKLGIQIGTDNSIAIFVTTPASITFLTNTYIIGSVACSSYHYV